MRREKTLAILALSVGVHANAGTLSTSFGVENGLTFGPGVVPTDARDGFTVGTYGLINSDPFKVNLTATTSGSKTSYDVLIILINLTSEPISEYVIDIEGPAQFGDGIPIELQTGYGIADESSSKQARFIPDIEWSSGLGATALFELEVLDPVGTPDITLSFTPVPEPSTAGIIAIGLTLIGRRTTRGRRRR